MEVAFLAQIDANASQFWLQKNEGGLTHKGS